MLVVENHDEFMRFEYKDTSNLADWSTVTRSMISELKAAVCKRALLVRKDPPYSVEEALTRIYRFQTLELRPDLRIAWLEPDPHANKMTRLMVERVKTELPMDLEVFDNEDLASIWLRADRVPKGS